MPYTDFTLERVEADFGLVTNPVPLYADVPAVPVPPWLAETLIRGRRSAAMISEKARSEFLVAPILTAVRELTDDPLTIFSGQRLDVDPTLGLVGECDYILALTPPVPRLKAPLLTIMEAKRGDIEVGLGQCAAQMVGARLFNDRAGATGRPILGCVTTGDDWQFLRLEGDELLLDLRRYYLSDLAQILGIFREVIAQASGPRGIVPATGGPGLPGR